MSALAYLQQNPAGRTTLSDHIKFFKLRAVQHRHTLIAKRADRFRPGLEQGNYTDERWPEKGMRMARKLGMLSYRSFEEWRTRFGRRKQNYFPTELFGMNFEVESYLEAAARRFVHSFDPCSYLYLSRAMDWFDVADGYPDLPTALADIQLKSACVIGVQTDILFPVHQQKDIADALASEWYRHQLLKSSITDGTRRLPGRSRSIQSACQCLFQSHLGAG